MASKISHFSLLVRNQDEALAFYTEKLGFVTTEAHKAPDNTWYWLTIAPTKDSTISLIFTPTSGTRRSCNNWQTKWQYSSFCAP